MGSIDLPAGAIISVDTSPVIFAVERNLQFEPVLAPLWQALEKRHVQVIASELVIVETLAGRRDGVL